MTVADISAVAPKDGTGGGLLAMLDFCIKTGVLNQSTAKAIKTGVTKVLEIDDDYQNLDVVNMDEDAFLKRYWNLRLNSVSDGTKEAYQQRFRQARAMYLARLDGAKDWSSAGGRATPANGSSSRPSRKTRQPSKTDATASAADSASPAGGEHHTAADVTMIRYPLPIRVGVQGMLVVPEDLTAREAKRVSAFVAALAYDEQLAIGAGAGPSGADAG